MTPGMIHLLHIGFNLTYLFSSIGPIGVCAFIIVVVILQDVGVDVVKKRLAHE